MGGISIWQIAIIVIVVAVLFGGKRLRNLGGDLGTSLKGFKNAMREDEEKTLEHKDSHIETTVEKAEDVREKTEDKS